MSTHTDLLVGVITVSDRCSRGAARDASGPKVVEIIRSHIASQQRETENQNDKEHSSKCPRHHFAPYFVQLVVPDDVSAIQSAILSLTDHYGEPYQFSPQLIVTTGGTGFSPRDVTPEAVTPLIEKQAPGVVQKMLQASLEKCECAWISRAVCGVRKQTILLTLPGATKAVEECLLPLLQTGLLHALMLSSTDATPHSPFLFPALVDSSSASTLLAHGNSVKNFCARPRRSPYALVPLQEAIDTIHRGGAEYLQSMANKVVRVPLAKSLHHVLEEPLKSSFPHPPFSASIKDGYAVQSSNGVGVFRVMNASRQTEWRELEPNSVWRVNTGGPVPPGADAVVQVEDTELVEADSTGMEEVSIRILKKATPGQDIRPIGIDIPVETEVLGKKTFMTAAEIGLAASMGATHVSVAKKPIVAVFSTGDELAFPSHVDASHGSISPPKGKIFDSNKSMLLAALQELKYHEVGRIIDMGIVSDTLASTRDKIEKAFDSADVVLSTGGVSMGDVDHIKQALLSVGAELHFGRVNMKPGKPTTFAVLRKEGNSPKFFFGLPGNPVSALVCFHLFVTPLLRQISGFPESSWNNPIIEAIISDDAIGLDTERPEYMRCMVTLSIASSATEAIPDLKPTFLAKQCGGQASSRLLSMVGANGLMILPVAKFPGEKRIKGDIVKVLLIGPLQ